MQQTQYMINGRYDACLTPMDRGFAYGDGIFRTLPVRQGVPHCWERHYTRLSDDCKRLSIVCPPASVIFNDIMQLCDKSENAAIKIIVTRGESGRGYAVPAVAQPNRVVIKSPLPAYPEQHSTEGVSLHLCQTRIGMQPQLAGVKHLNRLENVLARMEWTDAAIAEGLLLDAEDAVIECTMSNLFMRHGSKVTTPDLSRCGVAGVTRSRILEMLPALGFEACIARVTMDDLMVADEVLISNSLFGAWQVRRLNGHVWPVASLAATLRSRLESDDAFAA